MAISGIGYTQTYYYDSVTNKFTSKDKYGEAIAESLNGEQSPVRLADFEKQQKALLKTFLRMQQETGNRWDRYAQAESQEGIYEITYIKENELEASVYVGDQEAFRQMAAFCLPGTFDGTWDYEFPEKEPFNQSKNSATIVPGDIFTLKNGYQIEVKENGVSVKKESYDIGSRQDDAYAEKMAAILNEFLKTANRGCFSLSVSALESETAQDIMGIVAQTGVSTAKEFTINGTRFEEEDGKLNVVGAFENGSKVWEREEAWRRGTLQDLLHNRFAMDDKEIRAEREKYPSGVPKKGENGPYGYLADENGIIEYNGVIFTVNKEKNWLCLGDVSNLDNVIRIPLSEGGCLMVNRDSIGALGRAIGMFSPEDINLILRALKLDAKIQEMKKEIDDMEDGIGKNNEQEYADSAEDAKKAAKKDAGGFNGYGMKEEEDGVFRLMDWQLALLLGEDDEEAARRGIVTDPVMELAGQREEKRNERDF